MWCTGGGKWGQRWEECLGSKAATGKKRKKWKRKRRQKNKKKKNKKKTTKEKSAWRWWRFV